MNYKKLSNSAILLIILLTLLIRLIHLNQSLWLDEAIIVEHLSKISFIEAITQYAIADFHPPGYVILLWSWINLFGNSEISVRIPSVAFGTLSVYLVYLIGKKLVSNHLGLIAALLLAVNPLHIYYSQEARMYMFASFAVVLNMYLFIRFIKQEKYSFLALIPSYLLLLSSDYLAIFTLFTQLIFLIYKNKGLLIKWVTTLLLGGLALSWWIPLFINQLQLGLITSEKVPGWKNVVGDFGIKPVILTLVKFIIGRVSFDNDLIYAGVLIPITLVFLYLFVNFLRRKDMTIKMFLLLWLVIPPVLALIISIKIPIFNYFRLLFILPAFLLIVALGIERLKGSSKVIFLSLVVIIELIFSITYLLNPKFQREDWKGLKRYLNNLGEDQIVLLESNTKFSPVNYYMSDSPVIISGALNKFPASNDSDLIDIESLINSYQTVYLLDYLVEIGDPSRLVSKRLESLGFNNTQTINFNGVGFLYEYKKNQ